MRMKALLESKFDPVAEALYLRYSGKPVARTEWLDGPNGSVSVDLDVDGDPVGIEVVVIDDETVALATRYANENGLGLTGATFPRAA